MSAVSSFTVDHARAEAILDARTAALSARREVDRGATAGAVATLVVSTGGCRFALPFGMLALTLAGRPLHALPVRDEAVIGAVHERGKIWVVYALAALAGVVAGRAEDGRVLLLEHAGHRAALAVDAAEGQRLIDPADLAPIGQDTPGAGALLRRATPDGVMLLDQAALSARLGLAGRRTP